MDDLGGVECSQKWMVWDGRSQQYRETIMCFNDGFTIFLQFFYNAHKVRVYNSFTIGSHGACLQYVRKARALQ